MKSRTLRWTILLPVVAVLALVSHQCWGIGFHLRHTKEELKLKYDLAVTEHDSGRVTIVFTVADEGRLKPLDGVDLVIRSQEDGGKWMDMVVSIDMQATNDGQAVGRAHLRKEWAARAEIWLNTHTLDGKLDPLTRLHHVIPVARHLK